YKKIKIQMKGLLLLALASFTLLSVGPILLLSPQTPLIRSSQNVNYVSEFENFNFKYNKQYQSQQQYQYRLQVFTENLKYIEQQNKKSQSFTLGVNSISHLTREEFIQTYLGLNIINYYPENISQEIVNVEDLPDSVDWRTQGAVTPVKDQGQCGSCWAFSTTGSLEGANYLQNKTLSAFSEQQLMDCSWLYGNLGCNGGLMPRAFKWVASHGVTTEDKYPYEAKSHFSCKNKNGEFKISSYQEIPVGDCDALAQSVSQRPTSIAVDASNWQSYSSGVFDDCATRLNHGVLAVGYTSEYWIVKNSWNTSWGQQGYINLKRGNTCGLCNSASYPVA
ncbi:papain family cysteine protease, putative, partial [Ichthyophthirius multifiliis]